MSVEAPTEAGPVRARAAARLGRVRRSSLAVLVLLVLEFGFGMYVNLYVMVPRADRHGGVGGAVANGPVVLSLHAVLGFLLGVGALAVLVQAIVARHPGAIAASAIGLLAMVMASALGASFTASGDTADSMGMAVMTAIALLCYALNLVWSRPPARRG